MAGAFRRARHRDERLEVRGVLAERDMLHGWQDGGVVRTIPDIEQPDVLGGIGLAALGKTDRPRSSSVG